MVQFKLKISNLAPHVGSYHHNRKQRGNAQDSTKDSVVKNAAQSRSIGLEHFDDAMPAPMLGCMTR